MTRKDKIQSTQMLLVKLGYDPGIVDGLWGPNTENAYDELKADMNGTPKLAWRPDEVKDANPNNWPSQDGEALNKYYGKVGENQVLIELPYPMRLSYAMDTIVTRTRCHERVKDSLERVLRRVLDNYGMDKIKELGLDIFGGCLNVRKKRGGSTYSTHSWGIALDFDPDNNRLKWGRDKAHFARSEYELWWRCWEDEGWVSLGRRCNFDWMHVQAAKL